MKNLQTRKLIETNIYIFKENIKVLLGSIVEQLWAKNVLPDHLDNIIIKEVNKGTVDEIKEVEEEYRVTESMSHSGTLHVSLQERL